MIRRNFLKLLGVSALVVALPAPARTIDNDFNTIHIDFTNVHPESTLYIYRTDISQELYCGKVKEYRPIKVDNADEIPITVHIRNSDYQPYQSTLVQGMKPFQIKENIFSSKPPKSY